MKNKQHRWLGIQVFSTVLFVVLAGCTYGPQGVFAGLELEKSVTTIDKSGLSESMSPSAFAYTAHVEAVAGPALFLRQPTDSNTSPDVQNPWESIEVGAAGTDSTLTVETVFALATVDSYLYVAASLSDGSKALYYTDTSSFSWDDKGILTNDDAIEWETVDIASLGQGTLEGLIGVGERVFFWTTDSSSSTQHLFSVVANGAPVEQAIPGLSSSLTGLDGYYDQNADEYWFASTSQVFGGQLGSFGLDSNFPGLTIGEGPEAGDRLVFLEAVGSDAAIAGSKLGRLYLRENGTTWFTMVENDNSVLSFVNNPGDIDAAYLSVATNSAFYDTDIRSNTLFLATEEGYDLITFNITEKTLSYFDGSTQTEFSNQNSAAFWSAPVRELVYNTIASRMYVLSVGHGLWTSVMNEDGYLEWKWLKD